MAARDDMAAYMRNRRARLRAEREAARAGPSHTPLNLERARPARDAVKENRGVPVLTHDALAGEGGYRDGNKPKPDYLEKKKRTCLTCLAARKPASAAAPRAAAPIHDRDRRKTGNGPAIPGYDPTFAPHDGYAVSHRVNTVTMLQALAAQSDEQDAAIAALERVAADRKAQAADVAQALFGLFRHAFLSR